MHEVSAQSGSRNVTVNLVFRPIQTITVSTDQQDIDMVYATVNDHQSGVRVERNDHLSVFSTGGFMVTVEATTDHFKRGGGPETIPLQDLTIRASEGSGGDSGANFNDVALSTSPTPLISSDLGGNNLSYNVIYDNTAAGGNNHYINRYHSEDGGVTAYQSHITYTITTR